MLKLKLQHFDHLLQISDSLEKTLMLGKTEDRRRRRQQRMRWLDSITNSMDINLSNLREIVEDRGAWRAAVHEDAKSQTQLRDWRRTSDDILDNFLNLSVTQFPNLLNDNHHHHLSYKVVMRIKWDYTYKTVSNSAWHAFSKCQLFMTTMSYELVHMLSQLEIMDEVIRAENHSTNI